MIDWEARVRAQAARAHGATGHEAPWAAENDPGHVPGHVMPALCALAQRHGFEVKLTHGLPSTPDNYALGATMQRRGNDGGVIGIRCCMSDASTARVLGHELGHVLAYSRDGHDRHQEEAQLTRFAGTMEDTREETACELGTAAFCAAAGIGTGQFLRRYLGQHSGGHVSEQAIADAARNAEALWDACAEYQAASGINRGY